MKYKYIAFYILFMVSSLALFLSFSSPLIFASSYDGIPYLCPDGVNKDAVTSYCQQMYKGMFVPDSNGLCNNKNCEELREKAVETCVLHKIEELDKNINDCIDKFNEIIKVYSYDWSKEKWTPEMENYKIKSYDYGTFMIESCIQHDGYIPIYDYEEPQCLDSEYIEDDSLKTAMEVNSWHSNLCNFEKTYYDMIKGISARYEKCHEDCNKEYDVENKYRCNEENSWMYAKSECPKTYTIKEYNEALEESYKCDEKCVSQSKEERSKAESYFYNNCLAYTFYTYQYLYNIYAPFYGVGYYSGNEKFYNLKNSATFLKGKAVSNKEICPDGYKLVDGVCVIDVNEHEKLTINLDSNILDLSKTNKVTGTLTYECNGDCSGEPVVLNIDSSVPETTFAVNYKPSVSYLDRENPSVRFTIIPKFSDSIAFYDKITLSLKTFSDEKEVKVKLMPIDTITLKRNFNEPVKQGDTVSLSIKVNGPDEYDYTYILSSALDGTFYYNNKEMPITAFISSTSNEIKVKWKTPLISRKVNARDFYIDELGQLSAEGLSTVASAIAETLSGNLLKKGFSGHDKLIEKGLGSASAINEFSSSDPVPFGLSVVALLHENAITSIGSSLTYSSYKAYQRATKRFDAFNSDKTHIYDVPIKVVVHPKGHGEISKTIKIRVEAPEVIRE